MTYGITNNRYLNNLSRIDQTMWNIPINNIECNQHILLINKSLI